MASYSGPFQNRRRTSGGDLTFRRNPTRSGRSYFLYRGGEDVLRRRRQRIRPQMSQETNTILRRLFLQTPNKKEVAWDSVEEEIFSSTKSGDEEEVVIGESKDCSICLQNYKEGDELVRLPCGHRFHVDCLDSWIRIRSSCPYCRRVLHVRWADWVSVGICL